MNSYLSESGAFNLYFDSKCENVIKEKLEKENLELRDIKGLNPEMVAEDWSKMYEILKDIDLNCDNIFKYFYYTKLDKCTNINFYQMIIKIVFAMLEKGINIDKINICFKQGKQNGMSYENVFEDEVKKYQAVCRYELPDLSTNILENTDFVRDTKRKRPVNLPEFDKELKTSKLFTKTSDHNILIYDKTAEFIIRNKVLENIIRLMNIEVDAKPIYKSFNEQYDNLLGEDLFPADLQPYSYNTKDFTTSI